MAYAMDEPDLAAAFGEHVKQWRLVIGISQALLAQRATALIPIVARIEVGDPGVRMASFAAVVSALGSTKRLIEATDPLNTNVGRSHVAELGRKRARRQPSQ